MWNESKFRRLVAGTSGVAVYKSVAQHNASNKARATSKAANAKDGKYHKHLYLAAGAHVMVRNNMWTEGGVVNGAMGILRHLVVDPADNSVDTDGIRPVVALVEMDNFKCANPLVPSQPKLVHAYPHVHARMDSWAWQVLASLQQERNCRWDWHGR